jgi:hypothetical protein
MKQVVLLAMSALGVAGLAALAMPQPAHAVTCANGVYRAGCAGPNGAAVARKTPPPPPPRTVNCANGVYRAGCVGPNGTTVIKK